MYQLSACLEWLFTEVGADYGDRIRAAADHGLGAVEIWQWRNKDLHAISRALAETGTMLQSMCTDPMTQLTDPASHPTFLAGFRESVDVAERFGCPFLVVTAGDRRPGFPRDGQHAAVVEALVRATESAQGRPVTLILENLNSRVDHIGTFCDSTAEVLGILRDVGSPQAGLLFDAYHALVMGERPEVELAGSVDRLAHVQIADAPGRGEPGSGAVDWARELSILRGLGYSGRIGLEYRPTTSTADSLQMIERLAELA